MKNRVKLSIVCSAALMLTLGTGVLLCGNQVSNVFAAEEKQWTREEVGKSLETLREVPVEQIAAWEIYDSRDYDIVTRVKNQGSSNLCWAYSTAAVVETSAIREGIMADTNIEIDPIGIAKALLGYQNDPLDLHNVDNSNFGKTIGQSEWNVGAQLPSVALTASRWYGLDVASNSTAPGYGTYRVENVLNCANDVNQIKDLIASYGSVAFAYTVQSNFFGNYFYTNSDSQNHASVIVGWDDTIPASNFQNAGYSGVTNPGAWIVRNSWGESSHNKGYYYLSYESTISQVMTYDVMTEEEYDYNYNYAGEVVDRVTYVNFPAYSNLSKFCALYQAKMGTDKKVELLKGISVGIYLFNNATTATVKIYKNPEVSNGSDSFVLPDEPVAKFEKQFKYTGIYTIELPEAVELENGEWYCIEVELSDGASIICEAEAARDSTNDKTYVYWGGWQNMKVIDSHCTVALIRGLTVAEEDPRTNISDFTVTLKDEVYTYNGQQHTPQILSVSKGDIVLDEDDYTISYKDNVNAGQGSIIVKGQGDYRGLVTVEFTINKAKAPEFGSNEITAYSSTAKTLKDIELPKNWKWKTSSTALTDGMTAVAVYTGADKNNFEEIEVTVKITYLNLVADFMDSVREIQNASSLKARYELIKTASEKWNALPKADRAQAQEGFKTLQAAIKAYNDMVDSMNEA